jgi:peptidoglycan/LPS O-acetylase OafA/YrhL
LPGLDGLRALAVIAVFIYHATSWLPGGFLGVEVFFVISGYIITSVLLAEQRRAGAIGLRRFWLRRARRLLPAVFVLIVAMLAYAVVFLPDEVASLRLDALAAAGYVTNWYLIFDHQPYFASFERPSLLRHLWSLAIEEQFYLVWPLAFLVLCRLRPWVTVGLLVTLALGSAALMTILIEGGGSVSRLYYGTDTRASGLLIGAAVAFVWQPGRLPALDRAAVRASLNTTALGAIAILTALHFLLDDASVFLYRGGFLVTAVVTALLIALAVHPRLRARQVLGVAPLRWLGQRSYSVYLWHWPVIMLTRPEVDIQLDGASLFMLRLGLTLGLAMVSYQLVELPVRNGALGRAYEAMREGLRSRSTRHRLGLTGITGATAGLVALIVTVFLAKAPGVPSYLPSESIRIISTSETAADQQTSRLDLGVGASVWQLDAALNAAAAPYVTPPTGLVPHEASIATSTGISGLPSTDSPLSSTIEVSSERLMDDISAEAAAAPPPPPPPPPALPAPRTDVRITAIGDSVMLGAALTMAQVLPDIDIDAAVGRQSKAIVDIVRQRVAQGGLGEIAVIQVGNNGDLTAGQLDEILTLLSDVETVVLVNLSLARDWESHNNGLIAAAVERHENAVLADWYAASHDRPDYFVKDRVHLQPAGAAAFAATIAAVIPQP